MITAVTLNPTLDICFEIDAFLAGSVHRAKRAFSYPGGKGTNVARGIAALGGKVSALGFCAAESVKDCASVLEKGGVKPRLIAAAGRNRPCCIISSPDGETVINSESSIGITPGLRKKMLSRISELSAKSSVMVFSGSLPLALSPGFYADCVYNSRDNCVVILDTSSKYLSLGVKARPHIIKQNLGEYILAFGKTGAGKKQLATSMEKTRKKYGLHAVIITLGARGSALCDKSGFSMIPPVSVPGAVSSVGSGDAYSAGLAFGIEKGLNIYESCALASACGAANTKYSGSCFFSSKDVKEALPLAPAFAGLTRLL